MPKAISSERSNFAGLTVHCEQVDISSLKAASRITRSHSQSKMNLLERMLVRQGQLDPITINSKGVIVDGHARVEIFRRRGWKTIAAIRIEHLSDEELRLHAIAANKLPSVANIKRAELIAELEELDAALPGLSDLSGYTVPEIDMMLGAAEADRFNDLDDDIPVPGPAETAISRLGDLYRLGDHAIICGSSTDPAVLAALMDGAAADIMFADPPYNVPINGHVSGNGKVKHREFAEGVGEMSRSEFTAFLAEFMRVAAAHLADGALSYVCMDHAHLGELLDAGDEVFHERKAICVWDKGAGGMGSLYRNACEMIGVFKHGDAPHTNNIMLGKNGRNRTTIWRYPGVAQFGKGRNKALSLHPTVKPVALVANALLDASARGGIVLDPFGGSGTTLIAAERTQRVARLVEIDPLYVDATIARFEKLTGIHAIHADTGLTFAELRENRLAPPASAIEGNR